VDESLLLVQGAKEVAEEGKEKQQLDNKVDCRHPEEL
jgi:hypothetical protein